MKDYYGGVNFLVWLFYVSKYYELLDTVILLLKGKPSSFLQTFHHSGSIISLWTMTVTRIPGMWIFTFLNSFIHTIMYIYYTLTCLGHQPSWKRMLTSMQITQFFIGNTLGILYFVIPGCFPDNKQFRENVIHSILGSHYRSVMFTFAYNFAFVGSLILLFNDFARRTYGKRQEQQIAAAAEKKIKVTKAAKTKATEEAEPVKKAKKATKSEKPAAPSKRVSRKSTAAVSKSEDSLPEVVVSEPSSPVAPKKKTVPAKKRAASKSKSRAPPVRRRSVRNK